MNKMSEIAALYGKELLQEFTLISDKGAELHYMFDGNGFWYLEDGRKAINDHHMLLQLLLGKARIVD